MGQLSQTIQKNHATEAAIQNVVPNQQMTKKEKIILSCIFGLLLIIPTCAALFFSSLIYKTDIKELKKEIHEIQITISTNYDVSLFLSLKQQQDKLNTLTNDSVYVNQQHEIETTTQQIQNIEKKLEKFKTK